MASPAPYLRWGCRVDRASLASVRSSELSCCGHRQKAAVLCWVSWAPDVAAAASHHPHGQATAQAAVCSAEPLRAAEGQRRGSAARTQRAPAAAPPHQVALNDRERELAAAAAGPASQPWAGHATGAIPSRTAPEDCWSWGAEAGSAVPLFPAHSSPRASELGSVLPAQGGRAVPHDSMSGSWNCSGWKRPPRSSSTAFNSALPGHRWTMPLSIMSVCQRR